MKTFFSKKVLKNLKASDFVIEDFYNFRAKELSFFYAKKIFH